MTLMDGWITIGRRMDERCGNLVGWMEMYIADSCIHSGFGLGRRLDDFDILILMDG